MNTTLRDTLILSFVTVLVVVGYLATQPLSGPGTPPPMETAGAMGAEHGNIPDLPEDHESLVVMGNQLMDQGNFPMAAECYGRALDLRESLDVRVDYGACLHAMGLPLRALEEFRNVAGQDPDHRIANYNLGIIFFDQQVPDSARHYFNRYLQLDPEGPAAPQARSYIEQLSQSQ